MSNARGHYKNQLSAIYTWMAGGATIAVERNRALFVQLEIDKWAKGLAVDLGAGSGFQSIPLAEMGFSVVAVDFSAELLAELTVSAKHLPVQIVQDDLSNFNNHIQAPAQLIVCMGDTLTHLESPDALTSLFKSISSSLSSGGKTVLSFRDYVSREPGGAQRFIPVRSDDSRIHTCFLEYQESSVEVYDVVHTKLAGEWKMSVSSYPKLRLAPAQVAHKLEENGIRILHNDVVNGMVVIVGEKA